MTATFAVFAMRRARDGSRSVGGGSAMHMRAMQWSHPTAIATTLAGARKRYPGRKLWALFEPRSISSSRKEFEAEYAEAFTEADRVIIGRVFHRERYETRYGIDKMMSVPEIVRQVSAKNVEIEQIDAVADIARRVAEEAREG